MTLYLKKYQRESYDFWFPSKFQKTLKNKSCYSQIAGECATEDYTGISNWVWRNRISCWKRHRHVQYLSFPQQDDQPIEDLCHMRIIGKYKLILKNGNSETKIQRQTETSLPSHLIMHRLSQRHSVKLCLYSHDLVKTCYHLKKPNISSSDK